MPQGPGLLSNSRSPGRTPPHKAGMPTEPPQESTGPGLTLHRFPSRPRTAACWRACRGDDKDAQSSRGPSGLPFPFKVASGLRPTQPPTAKVEEATSLNARILHTLAPSSLPARPPPEEGIIKQTSQPPTTCGFYLHTDVLLEMGAQNPGSQEKSSLTQNANGRPRALRDPTLCVSLKPPPRYHLLALRQVRN